MKRPFWKAILLLCVPVLMIGAAVLRGKSTSPGFNVAPVVITRQPTPLSTPGVNAPFIGAPRLRIGKLPLRYELVVPINHVGPGILSGTAYFMGDDSDIYGPGVEVLARSTNIAASSSFKLERGRSWISLLSIPQVRKKAVQVELKWRLNGKSGVKEFTVESTSTPF